jgi:predicted DNA-binding transcriptional regulator YafY
MARSSRSQKTERLNAAYALLAQGVTASEAVLRLSQRFGLSQRQAYRYLQDARAMGQPVEPAEALVPITIKIPGTLAEALRAHSRSSGDSIGEIVARALRRFFSDVGRHG